MKFEAYAVWVDGVLDGIIRTPDARSRAETRAELLRTEGRDVRVVVYDGVLRKPS